MKAAVSSKTTGPQPPRSGFLTWFVVGTVAVIALVLFLPRGERKAPEIAPAPTESASHPPDPAPGSVAVMRERRDVSRLMHSRGGGGGSQSPEAIVANGASDFARGRREVVNALAAHFGVQVPPEVERFFDAAEGGNWEDIKRLFNDLSAAKEASGGARDLDVVWPAVREAYGVAVLAKSWPAQELLDYGQSILSSLQPGAIYVAGSDAARFAPMLLAESSGGDRPIILPQSGLGEGSQLDYLGFLHGDQLTPLSRDDAKLAFDQFAEENQQRAAEAGSDSGSTPSISGLDERLLRMLIEKNPAATFTLEAATVMPGLYAEAVPLGPMLEVKAGGADDSVIATRTAQSLDYWRQTAERLQADNTLPPDSPSRTAYARMAAAQANYFAERNMVAEAEQAYRLGFDMAPASMDALGQLTGFLAKTGRQAEALQLVDSFSRQYTDHEAAAHQLRQSIQTTPAPGQ